jgi:hypothetical protein
MVHDFLVKNGWAIVANEFAPISGKEDSWRIFAACA